MTLGAVGTISEEYGLIPKGMSRKGRRPKDASPFKYSQEETGFLDSFGAIEDPRSISNQRYSISEILLLTLCAVLCGAEGWWQDIEDYGKAKLVFLRQYFDYQH